jgi:tRNA G18 (ribose-2'-O)-methylase SpoU
MAILAACNFNHETNIGTLIRTAEAFGIKEIIIIGRKEFNVYACMGSDKWVTITYIQEPNTFIAYCDINSLGVLSIDNRVDFDTVKLQDLPDALENLAFFNAFVFVAGSENMGVDKEILKRSDLIIEIPLVGKNPCLNTAVAASIVLWEYYKLYGHKI